MKISAILVLLLWASASTAANATRFGLREHVRILGNHPIEVTAVLDAKATHAVLKVESLKYVLHGNGTWVRFVVDSGNVITLQQARLDKPILRDHEVRMRDGGVRHEPVVALDICIGSQHLTVPFVLRIRQHYTPPMVLGAAQIARLGTIDPKAKFLHEPYCPTKIPAQAASH